jgi:hypothetical protein
MTITASLRPGISWKRGARGPLLGSFTGRRKDVATASVAGLAPRSTETTIDRTSPSPGRFERRSHKRLIDLPGRAAEAVDSRCRG